MSLIGSPDDTRLCTALFPAARLLTIQLEVAQTILFTVAEVATWITAFLEPKPPFPPFLT